MRSRPIILSTVGIAALGVTLAATSLAWADGEPVFDMSGVDGAICDTQEVVVRDEGVAARAKPNVEADELFGVEKGEFFSCAAVEVGEAHSECGAEDSEVWMILTDIDRFDIYVPSHCVADVYR